MTTETLEQIAMRVAKETCCELWGIEDIAFAPSKDMEDFVKTFARRLVAELQKGQEPVAWMIQYEGKCMGFVPHKDNGTVPVFAAPPLPVVPDGWKLVPVKLTEQMVNNCREDHEGDNYLPHSLWASMLFAAPDSTAEDAVEQARRTT